MTKHFPLDNEQLMAMTNRTVSRRRLMKTLAGAAGVVVAVPLLAACETDDDEDDSVAVSPDDDEEEVEPDDDEEEVELDDEVEPDDDPTPQDDDESVLRVVVGLDPGVLDPHGGNAAVSEATVVFGQIFETLVDIDYSDEEPQFVGVLATDWESVDEFTFEFRLREGVTFHNGDAFTADDVRYSVERILDPDMGSPATQYLPPDLAEIEIVDDHTVRVITENPYPLTLIRFSRVRIVPSEYAEEVGNDEFGQNPVGTGPFQFVEWVQNDHTTVERNDDYWGDTPELDQVIFMPRPEAGARTAALRAGEADIVSLLPIGDVETVENEDGISVASVPSHRAMFIHFDSVTEGPLTDPLVRQALNYAIDKDALIEHIMGGYAVKLQGQQVPEQFFGFTPGLEPYPYDPDRAMELLAEAGHPDGFEIQLRGPVGRYMQDQELTEAIGGQLEQIGLTVNVVIDEWSVYIGELYELPGLGPMFLLGWGPLPDALDMFTMHECDSVVPYHCNEEYDAMVEGAKQTVDEDERMELYAEIAEWSHQSPPVLFLHQQMNLYGVSDAVSGFRPDPDEFVRLHHVTKIG